MLLSVDAHMLLRCKHTDDPAAAAAVILSRTPDGEQSSVALLPPAVPGWLMAIAQVEVWTSNTSAGKRSQDALTAHWPAMSTAQPSAKQVCSHCLSSVVAERTSDIRDSSLETRHYKLQGRPAVACPVSGAGPPPVAGKRTQPPRKNTSMESYVINRRSHASRGAPSGKWRSLELALAARLLC